MIETAHSVDRLTGVPVHSLYSETREPTEEMLADVDVLVFDMQSVGCRIYTFAYTMANCMASRKEVRQESNCFAIDLIRLGACESPAMFWIRPLPLLLGQFALPTRHGLTHGELAHLFNDHF